MALDINPKTLSRSQMVMNNAPTNQSYVIEGGPGTGKTLLALLRIQKIFEIGSSSNNSKPKIKFIVFNRPLQIYLSKAFRSVGLSTSDVKTYHSWLWNIYSTHGCKEGYPKHSPYNPNWERVKDDLLKWHAEDTIRFDHVILDEAQDLPIELIEILKLISNNITVFIDRRQSIDEKINTKVEDVVNLVCTSRGRKFFLTENQRNSQAIIDLAMKFGGDEDMPDQSMNPNGRKPSLQICDDIETYTKHIIEYRKNNPDQIIGVLLPDNMMRDEYFSKFKKNNENVEKYISNNEQKRLNVNLDFHLDTNGIKLITVSVSKGLEFDTVFIPKIDDNYWTEQSTTRINQAMVAITRARNRLFLQCGNEYKESNSMFIKTLMENKDLIDIASDITPVTKQINQTKTHADFDDDLPF